MLPIGLNAPFAVATGVLGVRLDPYMPFNFVVEIDGLLTGGFQEVRGLESTIETEEYEEGGLNGYVHQLPGRTRYTPLVLSHGLTDLETLYNWYEYISRGVILRRHLTIMLLDHRGLPAMWWDVRDAFPVKWTGPTLNATQGGDVAVEAIELVHRGIYKSQLSRALTAARGAANFAPAVVRP